VTRRAADFANYTPLPTQQDFDDLRAGGYDTVIIGCSYFPPGKPTFARDQIQAWLAGGFRVEAYAWLRHPCQPFLLQRAIDAIAGLPVERLWLDVEDADDATGKTPDQLAWDVRTALDYIHARTTVPTGIYTGSWFWAPYMNTNDTFGQVLWLANYVTIPNVDFIYNHIPGGWTKDTLVIWQHDNHLEVSTFNADDNIILKETVTDMTAVETDAAIKAYTDPKFAALLGNAIQNAIDINKQGDQIKALALAMAEFAQNGNGTVTNAELQAQLVILTAHQAELDARIRAAGAVLNPVP
jgi:hypothetical protein